MDNVQIDKLFEIIKDRTALGLLNIGETIQQETLQRTPIQTGNLRLHWMKTINKNAESVDYSLFNKAGYGDKPYYYDRLGKRYGYGRGINTHERLFQSLIWSYATENGLIQKTILDYIIGKSYEPRKPEIDFDSRNIKKGRAGMSFRGVI
jgi:hypothetical protein